MTTATLVLADVTLESLIWWLIVGLIAGFLAAVVMRGRWSAGQYSCGLHWCLYSDFPPASVFASLSVSVTVSGVC